MIKNVKQNLVNLRKTHQLIYYNSSIDKKEIETFSQVKDWWQPNSSMLPLHAYNFARVNYLKKIIQKYEIKKEINHVKPFLNLNILDVGCGGGLFTESMARLGANVTGIDATFQSFQQAKLHSETDPELNIQYYHTTAEEHLQNCSQKYDIVSSLEVIEHVSNPYNFIFTLSQLLNPDGILIISTINRNLFSYLQVILGAEYVTRIVKQGTHDWNKFIQPKELEQMCQKAGLGVVEKQGFFYDFFSNQMKEAETLDVNYIVICQKQKEK